MNRVLVVGISGTGKTRTAKKLSEKLGLPVIHLDSIFWKENWQEQDPKIVENKIADSINNRQWIIEGYIEPLGRYRVQSADTVIYLDYSGATALLGGLQRWMQFRNKKRPEMPEGNVESFGFGFLMTLLRRDERPEIEYTLKGSEQKVIRLKTRKQTERYLKSI